MSANTDFRILRHGQVGIDFRAISGICTTGKHPLMRPDVVLATSYLRTLSGVNNDEGIDKTIPIIIIGCKVDIRVCQACEQRDGAGVPVYFRLRRLRVVQ